MSNQRMWLVCSAHEKIRPESGICLGKRLESGYYRPPSTQEMQHFFDEHEGCGGPHFDHFKLAFDQTPDYQANPLADPATDVKAAVKLALVK